jgi:putative transposase
LHLSKIGAVDVVLHRPLEGTPKTVTIKRSPTGKWYAAISCEWTPMALAPCPDAVGIDVSLHTFATLSSGETIENPQFFWQEEKALARAQRRLSRAAQGTPMRKRRRKAVARVHERTRWRRQNHAHQHSRRIINTHQVIAVEDLAVSRLVQQHTLTKSIHDAAWSEFRTYLAYKAAWAGRQYIAVNPAYTSQECSRCGHRQPMPLAARVYHCPACGLVLDRDQNAARNILARGLAGIGSQSVDAMPR